MWQDKRKTVVQETRASSINQSTKADFQVGHRQTFTTNKKNSVWCSQKFQNFREKFIA